MHQESDWTTFKNIKKTCFPSQSFTGATCTDSPLLLNEVTVPVKAASATDVRHVPGMRALVEQSQVQELQSSCVARFRRAHEK